MLTTKTMIGRVRVFRGVLVLFFILSSGSCSSEAFELKGYSWGESLDSIKERVKIGNKELLYDESGSTLVFDDVYFDSPCKVSLLFTPVSRQLAGVAFIWRDAQVAGRVRESLVNKYGQAAPSDEKGPVRQYFLWTSPVDRYDRIALMVSGDKVLLAYFGGPYYGKYVEESNSKS